MRCLSALGASELVCLRCATPGPEFYQTSELRSFSHDQEHTRTAYEPLVRTVANGKRLQARAAQPAAK
eukprot:5349150-Prymnesium_polylepis.1